MSKETPKIVYQNKEHNLSKIPKHFKEIDKLDAKLLSNLDKMKFSEMTPITVLTNLVF